MDNNLIDLSYNCNNTPTTEIVLELHHMQIKNIKELIHTSNDILNKLFDDPENLLLNLDKIEKIKSELTHSMTLLSTLEMKNSDSEKKEITEMLARLLLKANTLKSIMKITPEDIINHEEFINIKTSIKDVKESSIIAGSTGLINFILILSILVLLLLLVIMFYNLIRQ